MPLASSLRKRWSTRNLRELQDGTLADEADTQEGQRQDLLHPQSAATGQSTSRANSIPDDSSKVIPRPNTSLNRSPSTSWKRFSLLKQRHASDPQISSRYRQQGASHSESSFPPACPAPVVGFTSPIWQDSAGPPPKRKFYGLGSRQPASRSTSYNAVVGKPDLSHENTWTRYPFRGRSSLNDTISLNNSEATPSPGGLSPSINDTPSLISDRPSADRPATNQTEAASTESRPSSRFRLPHRNKQKKQKSLFPLPVHLAPSQSRVHNSSSQSAIKLAVQPSPQPSSQSDSSQVATPYRTSTSSFTPANYHPPPLPRSTSERPSEHSTAFRPIAPSLFRAGSSNSAPTVRTTFDLPLTSIDNGSRGRAGTMSSFHSRKGDERATTPYRDSFARTSMTSTTLGRNSIAGLRSFTSKLRHPSESSPHQGSPSGANSLKNSSSFALSREVLPLPEREEGESAAQYYARLEKTVPKKAIGQLFARSADPFSGDVLRSLFRTFKFFEEPLDISLRKFLWEIHLPSETQQIDRLINAFAQRYYECNPPLFENPDNVYLLAFSLIMLHSDLFNAANKRKMQRHEFQKNTRHAMVDEELLGYFYDNIQYTEFVNQLDDDDESTGRAKKSKSRKKVKKIKVDASEDGEKGKIDPYDFILDDRRKLDVLRPALKGVMHLDDTYHYFGTAEVLDVHSIRQSFVEPAILQTISSRSRPGAFQNQASIENTHETPAGVVDIKVAKVGIVLRKDPKKKPARSPWQEWGAVLTQSQMHFFRNKDWVKELVKQSENHHRQLKDLDAQLKQLKQNNGVDKLQRLQTARDLHARRGIVFRPPVQDFKPDYSIKTTSATALLDTSYDKHKHGFVLVNNDDYSEETLLADSEKEMNDWLAKVNFASAYTCAKIDIKPNDTGMTEPTFQITITNENANTTLDGVEEADAEGAPKIEEAGDTSTVVEVKTARQRALRARIEHLGNTIKESQETLREQLKTARHLQVLAPFPPKTRSDMLSFGARCAYRVRWSRFEIWRLKSHRDMLSADLIDAPCMVERETKSDPPTTSKMQSPRLLPTALSRLNSKASAIIKGEKAPKPVAPSTPEVARARLTLNGTDFAGSMDQALSPPPELKRSASSGADGPYKLPPLVLTATDDERPASAGTDSIARKSSTVSNVSRLAPVPRSMTPPPQETVPMADEVGIPLKKRPSTAMEPEKEQQSGFGSPSMRPNHRRSLQRTLRDSREILPQHRLSRKGKDSMSNNALDDNQSLNDREQLSRKPGSFTLHGKKASVITIGSDFQQLSAEERLRARKQALEQEDPKAVTEGIKDDKVDHPFRAVSVGSESHMSRSTTALSEAPLVGTQDGPLEYLGSPKKNDRDIESRRESTSTAVETIPDERVSEYRATEEDDEFHEPLESFKDRMAGTIKTSVDPPTSGERRSTADEIPVE